jgi:hypothetical protein
MGSNRGPATPQGFVPPSPSFLTASSSALIELQELRKVRVSGLEGK